MAPRKPSSAWLTCLRVSCCGQWPMPSSSTCPTSPGSTARSSSVVGRLDRAVVVQRAVEARALELGNVKRDVGWAGRHVCSLRYRAGRAEGRVERAPRRPGGRLARGPAVHGRERRGGVRLLRIGLRPRLGEHIVQVLQPRGAHAVEQAEPAPWRVGHTHAEDPLQPGLFNAAGRAALSPLCHTCEAK